MGSSPDKSSKSSGYTFFFAFLAVTFTLLKVSFPTILEGGVRGQLQLIEGNDFFNNFVLVPITINYKVHFFEVLNPREANNGAKLKVREVGPYWFK